MLEPIAQPNHQKTSIVMSVTARFDGMTWADLRRFVALADQSKISDGNHVAFDYGDDFEPVGLTFATHDAPRP